MEWLIFEEEYYRAGAPQRVTQNGIFLLAPTLFEFGTPEQQETWLQPLLRGEIRSCIGMTEPEVAAALGVSVGTVKSTVARAVAKLRKDAELGADAELRGGLSS